jgi:hypothetical protein
VGKEEHQSCLEVILSFILPHKLLEVMNQKTSHSFVVPFLSFIVPLQIALSDESENKPFSRLHHSQPSSYLEPSNMYGSFQDAYIPFPRTSGAKFCSVGKCNIIHK